MKLNVIGLGYIGLPTAAMFATNGVKVVGIDTKQEIIDTINNGRIHIEEPGLAEVVKEAVDNKMLRVTLNPEEADAFIICVPTPNLDDEYKSCDVSYIVAATKSILPFLKKDNLVIIESTIAPRTTEDDILPVIESTGLKVGKDIFLAHCPERVLPGQILNELINNNRIVGGITKECTEKAAELYSTFVKGEIIKTEAKTAEMSKLMENTFRDVNIALANELVKVCNNLDINALDVIEMANKHPRVNIHKPGPGVGGHCLAIDPYFICAKAPKQAQIIKLSRETNNSMPKYVVDNVEKLLNYDKSKIISAFGVTYKPNVDDLRESPALEIINLLIKRGYQVNIHDPHVKNRGYLSFEDSLKNSSLLLNLVAHNEFSNMDLDVLNKQMKEKFVFDVTGMLEIEEDSITLINYGNIWKYNN